MKQPHIGSMHLVPSVDPMLPSILLVDDSPVQAAVRREILHRKFADVAVSPDGADALTYFSGPAAAASIRMVITDHVMPRMGGPEFVRRLRELAPQIPVLVLSGQPDAESEYQGLGVTFRAKPFPPDQLLLLVSELICPARARTA